MNEPEVRVLLLANLIWHSELHVFKWQLILQLWAWNFLMKIVIFLWQHNVTYWQSMSVSVSTCVCVCVCMICGCFYPDHLFAHISFLCEIDAVYSNQVDSVLCVLLLRINSKRKNCTNSAIKYKKLKLHRNMDELVVRWMVFLVGWVDLLDRWDAIGDDVR